MPPGTSPLPMPFLPWIPLAAAAARAGLRIGTPLQPTKPLPSRRVPPYSPGRPAGMGGAAAGRVAASLVGLARTAAVALGLVLLAAGSAGAIELARQGNAVLLSGPIKTGDQYVFRDFLATQPPGIRQVWLASGGGLVQDAQEIGRRIRREGWATVVDASRSICASACTIVFAAGVGRHYVGTKGLAGGVTTFREARGLGYHEGSDSLTRQAHGYSGRSTAAIIGAYYEFGGGAASSLATLAPPDRIYVLAGPDALAKGIATSLEKP